ncbi:MAG: sigma 54-interacting transcriptional regulator [Candidatus Latescibacterota bacterium]|nr:MAG: sigma 54-interacting transcriptional regulator [Candidatus Latescibacterota bacterium]
MAPQNETPFVQTILRCIADGVFTVDRDWRITSFNRAAERITGWAAEEALGKKCSDIFHADICEHGCAIRKTFETGREVIDQPARILDSRGRAVPVSVSTAVLREEDGTLLGAVETFRDLSALEQLRREIQNRYTFEDIIGKSEAFQKIFAILPDVAESDSTVLIEGPSGSGKELLAKAIHNLSRRRKQPYVVVNCGTLPATLFESELFGYKRGAFTDAKKDKPGRIATAERGTIFFDEISELPPETQVKLLRVLQEREYEPLGAVQTRRANVRVVAATNKSLTELVAKGLFRDDLYFRLAVVRLSIPPLCERRGDIPYLVEHFIRRFNAKRNKTIDGVTPDVMEILMRYDYPGNVRELENVIEYGFVLCRGKLIDVRHLPDHLQPTDIVPSSKTVQRAASPLRRAEADAIRDVLAATNGHLGRAAQELGISRTTLWRKMTKYGISANDFRGE